MLTWNQVCWNNAQHMLTVVNHRSIDDVDCEDPPKTLLSFRLNENCDGSIGSHDLKGSCQRSSRNPQFGSTMQYVVGDYETDERQKLLLHLTQAAGCWTS